MTKYLTTIQKDMQDAFSRNIGSLDCTFFYPGDGYFIKNDDLNSLFAIRGIKTCRLNFIQVGLTLLYSWANQTK